MYSPSSRQWPEYAIIRCSKSFKKKMATWKGRLTTNLRHRFLSTDSVGTWTRRSGFDRECPRLRWMETCPIGWKVCKNLSALPSLGRGRMPRCKPDVDYHADTPHVKRTIEAFVPQHFGSQIGWGADHWPSERLLSDDACESKITQLHLEEATLGSRSLMTTQRNQTKWSWKADTTIQFDCSLFFNFY